MTNYYFKNETIVFKMKNENKTIFSSYTQKNNFKQKNLDE